MPPRGTWEVTSTDGTKRRYGTTADSKIIAGNGAVAQWLLAEIVDTYGNTTSITYDANPDGLGLPDLGVTYPKTIAYASGQRLVTFVYGPRPDAIQNFGGGIERHMSHRLIEIQVTNNGSTFRRQVLLYDAASHTTARTRLSSVHVFGSDCPAAGENAVVDPIQESAYPIGSATSRR